MAFKALTLTLTGVAQRLSDAYGVSAAYPAGSANPTTDVPYRALYLQGLLANTNNIFVGDSSAVSSTVHAFRINATDGDQPIGLEPGGGMGAQLHLSDFWVFGTNAEVLTIGGVPL